MATYYINADTGNNSHSGTSASPWKTIYYAYQQCSGGDTIYLQNSTATYAFDQLGNNTGGNINFAIDINIVGQSVAGCVVDSALSGNDWSMNGNFTCTNITFQNLYNYANGGACFYVNSPNGVTVVQTFTGCIFKNIELGATTNGTGVMGNNGTNATLQVLACAFINVYKSSASIIGGYWDWDYNATGNEYNIVENCTFCSTGSTPPDFAVNGATGRTLAFQLVNNIFYSITSAAWKDSGNQTYTGSNNCVYGFTSIPSGISGQAGYINADPLLVDPAGGNLNLRPTSPCLATGTVV